ncbi:MMPL family transporter [Nocardioides sp.]|uniref:MMPL family transporter n=1 Tax=Nocardioides sp. TaxID=35761 RepID=UPI0039E4756F
MFHRIGILATTRPRRVLAIGLVVLLASAFLATSAFGKLQDEGFDDPSSESSRASSLLDARFGSADDFVFAVTAADGSVTDASAAATVQALVDRMRADADLVDVVSFLDAPGAGMVSSDGRSGLVTAGLADDDVDAAAVIDRYSGADGDLMVRAGGQEAVFAQVGEQLGHDLGLAEGIAIPLILIFLVLAFGNLVAALVTVCVGGFAIVGTFAELSILGSFTEVSVYALNITTAMGLGLAVDYGLLMLARVREERSAGLSQAEAVVRAVETAGRTIFFSATTVAIALASMLVFPLYFLRSAAYAGIGVMVVTAFAGIVLLPAAITLLGDRIDSGRVPGVRGLRGGPAPFWTRLAGVVTRRPLVALPVLVVLLAMAAPLAGIGFGTPDERVLPASASSRQVGDLLREEFTSDSTNPIQVVTTAALPDGELADYAAALSRVADVDRVDTRVGSFAQGKEIGTAGSAILEADDAEQLLVVTQLEHLSAQARDQVRAIRAVPSPAGAESLVGGSAAELMDSLDAISQRLPLALVWLFGATVVLLFLFTGSVVQPLRALLLNLVGLGATVGAMVWIFQDGHLAGLLDVTPMPMNVSMFVLLLVITFGLSMDYEVFVLGRITEMRRAGLAPTAAVVQGLAHTGRIVSTAAALIAISFFAFVLSDIGFMKFFGLGAGLAILIDATLVRGVLLPTALRLLGEAAWWAPAPLRALHRRIGLREERPAAQAG